MPQSEDRLIDPRFIPPHRRGWVFAGNSSNPDAQAVLDDYEAMYPNQELLMEQFHPGHESSICWAVYRKEKLWKNG